MPMQTIEGVWGGTVNDVFETITIEPKVTFMSFRVASASLSCCPRAWSVTFEHADGTLSSNLAGGHNSLHYTASVTGLDLTSPRYAASAVHLWQTHTGCAGESFEIKVCITVTDVRCNTTNIGNKACGSTASYVDITSSGP